MYRKFGKRLIDILVSGAALLVLWPFLLLMALIVKLESSGSAIFKQERIGRNGHIFEILKFRTMCIGAEHTGSGVYSGKSDARVTRVGRILRATSIDELPQFINILRGDMSLIGPRPPLTYHPWPVEEYTEEQFHMFDVRPGVTGWAQVNGRKEVEWHRRIELNVWYVRNYSALLDLRILLSTVFKVLRNEDNLNSGETLVKTGVSQSGDKT